MSSAIYVLKQLYKYCPAQEHYGVIYLHLFFRVVLWVAKTEIFPEFTPLETKAVRMTETLQWSESTRTSIEKSQQLILPCLYIL